jgi:DNA-binding LytR/AlgR family response regulator
MVSIKAAHLNTKVTRLLELLDQLDKQKETLPIVIDDQVNLILCYQIVALEVLGEQVTIHTITQDYQLHGQLKNVLAKFVRISRSAALNLDYLKLLEPSFSGNMVARMQNNLKLIISRKYLPDLKHHLGL